MKWEYRRRFLSNDPIEELEAILNEMGDDGWECFANRDGIPCPAENTVYSTYLFKRPKVEAIEFPQPFLGDLT